MAPGGDDNPGGYSPDGRWLVFVRSTGDGTPVGLFVVGVDGRGLHRITPAGSDVSSPGAWSPDGKWIAFSRHADSDSRQSLWLVHPDGTGLHEIHVGISPACGGLFSDPNSIGCSSPAWAPLGDRIAFSVNKADGSHPYTADPTGQHVQHVADLTDGDFNPDWGVHPLAQ